MEQTNLSILDFNSRSKVVISTSPTKSDNDGECFPKTVKNCIHTKTMEAGVWCRSRILIYGAFSGHQSSTGRRYDRIRGLCSHTTTKTVALFST